MRYPASEKAEIIQLVEHICRQADVDKLGIPRATFSRWYDLYREGGPEALDDRRSRLLNFLRCPLRIFICAFGIVTETG